jgi:hypothetical protein
MANGRKPTFLKAEFKSRIVDGQKMDRHKIDCT